MIGEPRLIKINGQRGDFMKTEKAVVQENVGGLFWRDLLVFENIDAAKKFVADEAHPEDFRIIWRVEEVFE